MLLLTWGSTRELISPIPSLVKIRFISASLRPSHNRGTQKVAANSEDP